MTDPKEPRQSGYETTDVRTGLIWIVAIGVVAGVALSVFAADLTFRFLHRHNDAAQQHGDTQRVTQSVAETRTSFPEPRLQTMPQADLAAMRAREETQLTSYGWVDRPAGIVRLPIDRAMELVAGRGLPSRGDPNAPPPSRTPLDMQQARPAQREPSPPVK